jgi:r-opsin
MNPLWHSLIMIVIAILGLISVTGNGMVVYIFCTTKALRTPSNMLVVNLAFSDFLMMFCMAPPMIINCYNETWVFGPMFCSVYAMIGSLMGCASIWSMTAIAQDRYNVIVKGLAAKPLTAKGAALHIFLVWAFSLAWTLFPMFGWSRYVPEGNMSACGTDYLTKDWVSRSYILTYSFACYFLPLGLIIYFYFFIVSVR